MAKAATTEDLRNGFTEHLEQTRGHVERLKQIFEALGQPASGKRCVAMEGMVEEGSEIMEDDFEGEVLDAALVAAAQRVEHHEIAAYGRSPSQGPAISCLPMRKRPTAPRSPQPTTPLGS